MTDATGHLLSRHRHLYVVLSTVSLTLPDRAGLYTMHKTYGCACGHRWGGVIRRHHGAPAVSLAVLLRHVAHE